jgi:hypothetical protein
VSDESTSDFITVPVNQSGTSEAGGDMLPLFNSAKILFADGSFGLPDYKYIKGYLKEGTQTDSEIDGANVTFLQAQFQALIDDLDAAGCPLVSKDNDQYVTASVQTAVQMRQMHRKRKRTAPAP